MGLGVVEDDHNSTPKLSLSRLPCKPKQPPQMLTPPLHPSLSVPFRWEEAPGKPRFPAKSKAERSLELPPRLMLHDDAGLITVMPSPAMTLDGPYAVARLLSLASTFSFRRGLRPEKIEGSGSFGSCRRWTSKEEKGSFDILHSFKPGNNSKIRGMGRVRSFFTFNSNLLDFCQRLKQAMPWRSSSRR